MRRDEPHAASGGKAAKSPPEAEPPETMPLKTAPPEAETLIPPPKGSWGAGFFSLWESTRCLSSPVGEELLVIAEKPRA